MPNAKKRRGVTQRDIATLAMVSQATVSRVIAGDPRVDSETIQRVQQVIRDANYQPDQAARTLRNRRSGLIGLVIKRPSGGLQDDPFFANLIAGLMDVLAKTNYHLCVDIVSDTTQSAVYDEMLRTRRVDGLILVESQASDERIERLQSDEFPFVLIGNPAGALSDAGRVLSVDNDNVEAARKATLHLLDSGYERVGMIGGPSGVIFSEERIAGYKAAVESRGCCPMCWHSDFGLEAARKVASGIFKERELPDALLVLDDFMAAGVVLAARQNQLRIPEDLALAGFNDSSYCSVLDCGLTSVSLNINMIVQTACSLLLRVIEDKFDPGLDRRIIVPSDLVVRGSSLPRRKVSLV